mmetsp:Transcript_14201/g.29737  ORF Transcript_14201/g.29737 Transcript_14201/m.29737 type:complete len:964 (+) Transcript_14201:288-3179(+)
MKLLKKGFHSKSKEETLTPTNLNISKHATSRRSSDPNSSHNNNNSNNSSIDKLLEGWGSSSTATMDTQNEEAEDAYGNEPKQQLFLGNRRGNEHMDKISGQMRDLHMKEGSGGAPKGKNLGGIDEAKAGGDGGGGKGGGYSRPSTTSITTNVLCNIHSTPIEFDMTYTPPIYPKTEEDAQFISLALQRNFVFANALSDDDVIRKREMRQVVDAFEFHKVKRKGEMILSHAEVGDYFYILKEGSVRYYNDFKSRKGKVIGLANKPGQSFGELCLLYDCPPPADCVSSGDPMETINPCGDGSACAFWRIHRSVFRQILALRAMRRDVKVREGLQRVECLKELDGEYLKRIADAMVARNVEKGEVLYQEGDKCETLYLIGTEGKIQISSSGIGGMKGGTVILGPWDSFGDRAIAHALPENDTDAHKKRRSSASAAPPQSQIQTGTPRHTESALALERTVILSMSYSHFLKVVGSLHDAVLLSRDRRLLRSVPLFRDSDIEDFEYELLTALIENVRFVLDKEIFVEGDNVDEPALYIVRSGAVEVISEDHPKLNRIVQPGGYFGEDTLTPDENMKFGGAKGGHKYSEATVDVITDEVVLGRLTLANIDSVIQDLHRLGCRKNKNFKRKGRRGKEEEDETPESLDDLEFHRLFGAGTFGRVWIVSPFGKRTAYALKIQSKRELLDQRQAGGVQRERAVMSKLDHPFVCKLVNTFQDEACIYMLLQFVQGGELLNLIQGGDDFGGLPESAAKFFAAGILEGLTHMHQRQIVYRDLKPENILIDRDGYAVIIDFGFSKIVTDKTYTFCGTPLYLAPEIILSRGHDRGVDYWALGCLVYEMLFGTTPFYERGIDQKGLFKRIVRGKWNVPRNHNRVNRSAIEFIWGMLQRRPAERLGCLAGGYRDIKNHAWLQEVNFGKLIKKQIQAPWVPDVVDPLDTSNFESLDDAEDEDFLQGKAPLTPKEQIVFQDF